MVVVRRLAARIAAPVVVPIAVLATALAVLAAVAGPVSPAGAGGTDPTPPAAYHYSLLSTPDFLNADIADVRGSAHWRPGDPNSIDPRYRRALDTVMDVLAAEHVPDVAVAGDLVNGHWGIDTAHTGIFGPTRTLGQRRRAVRRAARLYYGQWAQRFAERGLRPLPALGDHELGDNPWHGRGGKQSAAYNGFKQRTVPFWKAQFGRDLLRGPDGRRLFPDHPPGPARNTAYAVRLHPEVQLITLDVFRRTRDDVVEQVDPAQLRWLRRVLRRDDRDGVDWRIVQFHKPVVEPVREVGSSDLRYLGGTASPLWHVLRREHVNLVLNGEVHAVTAHQPRPGDPVQITHGGLFQFGLTNYLRIDIDGDVMSIAAEDFRQRVGPPRRLWQTDTAFDAPAWVRYSPTPRRDGAMTLTQDGRVLRRSGLLGEYRGTP